MPTSAFLSDLHARGLIHQCSDEPALHAHLADPASAPRTAYAGFDPTADSLTIGNLVPLMLLVRFARAGHHPVALLGGGTGLIGDPSGKSSERELQTEDRVRANVESIRTIFARIFANAGLPEPTLVNNLDWLGKLGYLEVLRDVGKFFSVNQMIVRDSVRSRLEGRDHGISYTEFSYMILQAFDYLHLHRTMNITLQMGGSDQWGNIVSGADLIRRAAAHQFGGESPQSLSVQAHALTTPLITKSDGTKFGKTESGAIWLSPHRTSPYAYYQFWLNAADADVERFLKTFTLVSVDEITQTMSRHAADPGARHPQRLLAREATALVHGTSERERAESAAAALFSGDIASLSKDTLLEVLAAAPATTHARASLDGDGTKLLDLLATTSLAKSKSEARQFLSDGSISINGTKATADAIITPASLLHGSILALRRGKKSWHVCTFA
jgi:tyrosyl-tRNA synthetase